MILISCFNFILVWFNLGFLMINTGEAKNRRKQSNSHHPILWCEIRTTLPPCAKLPLWAFSKNHALGPYPKSQCENAQECEHCVKFAQHYSTCAKFAPPYPPVRNSHHPTPILATFGHISISSRSSFHAYYISFQILGSQKSIASNGTRFGVETKKLWPFEDDCAKLNGNVAAAPHFATFGKVITTQKVLFYTFNSLCFKHFCVVVLHLYPNWHVKDLAMTFNHICG